MPAGWTRTHEALGAQDAIGALDRGTPWAILWCGGRISRSSDRPTDHDGVTYVRGHLIEPVERERLFTNFLARRVSGTCRPCHDLPMVIVRRGRWLYADAVDRPVDIVGLSYDFWFALAEADGQLESDESPAAPGEDGLLYYVRFTHAGTTSTPTWPDSISYPTIAAAVRAAEERAPTTITWE